QMMLIGRFEAMQRLTVVRRLCDHVSIRPKGDLDQSNDSMTSDISPPPVSHPSRRPRAVIDRASETVRGITWSESNPEASPRSSSSHLAALGRPELSRRSGVFRRNAPLH